MRIVPRSGARAPFVIRGVVVGYSHTQLRAYVRVFVRGQKEKNSETWNLSCAREICCRCQEPRKRVRECYCFTDLGQERRQAARRIFYCFSSLFPFCACLCSLARSQPTRHRFCSRGCTLRHDPKSPAHVFVRNFVKMTAYFGIFRAVVAIEKFGKQYIFTFP